MKLSIIVPAHNAELYLRDCVESLFELGGIIQNRIQYEIILVDNASTDKTSELCEQYAKRCKEVICIHASCPCAGGSRNVGIENASGDWIGFVDSDDIIIPTEYAKMVEMAVEDKADVILSNHIEFNDKGEERHIVNFKSFEIKDDEGMIELRRACFGAELSKKIMNGEYGAGYQWGKLYKRSIICGNNIRFIDDFYGEDVMFVYTYLKYVKTAVCDSDNYTYKYRVVQNSVSHGFMEVDRLTYTMDKMMEIRKEEKNQLLIDAINVQIVRMLGTSFKHYFIHSNSGNGKIGGFFKFVQWKKPYVKYARECKNHNLPMKLRIFKLIL